MRERWKGEWEKVLRGLEYPVVGAVLLRLCYPRSAFLLLSLLPSSALFLVTVMLYLL